MQPSQILARLEQDTPRPCSMVLDTDTYNEIDDQFALTYALLADDVMRCEAVYAAPFHNSRSDNPADGMQKSFAEIERVCTAVKHQPRDGIYKGSERWMTDSDDSVPSAARDDLIKRALDPRRGDEPLYVVAIGAPTNVASAISAEPRIKERIVVVWLGGNPQYLNSTREFNCMQDWYASKTLFDSGVPMLRIPCESVAEMLRTTNAEMKEFCRHDNDISRYLLRIYQEMMGTDVGVSKVIWDISAIAWLIDRSWFKTITCNSPILNENMTFSFDQSRHPIQDVIHLNRDAVFKDLFRRVAALSAASPSASETVSR